MSLNTRSYGGATLLGQASGPTGEAAPDRMLRVGSSELIRSLAEVKGQAQFMLYLADQLEDALQQLSNETDPGHSAFLAKILSMYSSQMENKHQGLGDRIAEVCQEIYVTVREHDLA